MSTRGTAGTVSPYTMPAHAVRIAGLCSARQTSSTDLD